MLRLGLDIGGTKIEAQLLDDKGACLLRQRIPTPNQQYDTFLDAVTTLIHHYRTEFPSPFSVGIGLPGAISPDNGRIKNSNILILNGQDLQADLAVRLEQPVSLANDADCFALSEAVDGAGKDGKTVFGAILGTGCGGGVVVNKQLLSGPNAIAGEWGHNLLPGYTPEQDGTSQPCYCGRSNCLERFVSGTGFATRFNQRYDTAFSAADIMAAKGQGDRHASTHYQHFIDALARSLGSVINLIDPHVIVLGGGLSNIDSLYDDLPAALLPYVFSDRCNTKLVKAKHGDSSGVRGAAWLPGMSA
jgi:Transcriptional regulator/sugar kinase